MATFGGLPDSPQPVNVVKTHDPPVDDGKAIYIVRDGRSAVVSYWRYLQHYKPRKGLRGLLRPLTLARVVRGNVMFGSWSSHLQIWNPIERPNTLLLRYERVATDPNHAAEAIGVFLGLPRPREVVLSFRELQETEPAFFRSGDDRRNIAEMSMSDRRLFDRIHGAAMARYGYLSEI